MFCVLYSGLQGEANGQSVQTQKMMQKNKNTQLTLNKCNSEMLQSQK